MANWKERGVVPDSDDEEDPYSQSNTSTPQRVYDSRINDVNEVIEAWNNGDRVELELPQGLLGGSDDGFYADTNDRGDFSTDILNGTPIGAGISKETFPQSSPNSLRSFKVPEYFLDLDQDGRHGYATGDTGMSVDRMPTLPSPYDAQQKDDISRSYVRITSSTTSALSSPPVSQPIARLDIQPAVDQCTNVICKVPDVVEELPATQLRREPITTKRFLRHRNLNQLFPYQLELEKYRRELKARGIAPTMIAESQDRNRDSSPFSAPDSQSNETPDLGTVIGISETGESQDAGLIWDESPSSSVNDPFVDEVDNVTCKQALVSSDDEFPDIDHILHVRLPVASNAMLKRRTKAYRIKKTRPAISEVQTSVSARFQDVDDIFQIPASPPATSPPISSARLRKPLSRTSSASSKLPTPSRPIFKQNSARAVTELPTPVTSAAKATPIFVDSETDHDDPFASEREDSLSISGSSSSDESVQLRRVGKRIRGVLPASHLRLDLDNVKSNVLRTRRESLSMSPPKARRGIALSRIAGSHHPLLGLGNTQSAFLEDLSDDDQEGLSIGRKSPALPGNVQPEQSNLFNPSRTGFAQEESTIDPMLPSLKRQSNNSQFSKQKRQKMTSGSYTGEHRQYQPRITEHLRRSEGHSTAEVSSRKRSHDSGRRKRMPATPSFRTKIPAAFQLSILDIVDCGGPRWTELPQFLRVAARTAKRRHMQGKRSPSKIFIRLANREDTHDAQMVLQDWKDGKIQRKNVEIAQRRVHRVALQSMENNQQMRLRSPVRKAREEHAITTYRPSAPRKLVVSKKQQQRSMHDFVCAEESTSAHRDYSTPHRRSSMLGTTIRGQNSKGPVARPAQLESSEGDFSRHYPVATFRSSKKALDTLYRRSRKQIQSQSNLQLNRFLADDDLVQISTEMSNGASMQIDANDEMGRVKPQNPKLSRRKKRRPQRLDANAAIYRQPGNPLILDSLDATNKPDATDGKKLLGLGKYGTKYPLGFEILPLPPGTFFHESTLIGSGRLAGMISDENNSSRSESANPICLKLGDKEFLWDSWSEIVSSEIGVCFDWILEKLDQSNTNVSILQTLGIQEVFDSLILYTYRCGSSSSTLRDLIPRLTEVLNDFLPQVEKFLSGLKDMQLQPLVGVLEACVLLSLQLLRVSRYHQELQSLSFTVEELLKRTTSMYVGYLLAQGLETLRKLYDDLQYLSFRERGIRVDQTIAHGWVVVVKVLQAAKIPRGSFWDITNALLMPVCVKSTDDARTMENLWYSLFSLLPLCEFDDFGVIVPGMRAQYAFDNWPIPQQMLKGIFALYSANSRQSPGFNDYCRAIVSRCHFLMVEWGWWRCSSVIGTIFDFFASHNLAHLRNEEVYTSPRFLEELHTQPSFYIEPEDRCFHIFLKIVALGIKHLNEINDVKSIRHLVARLLPNHDRHFPKEEAIHQRDLASLRNHHDILCTLFWAAPPQQRPSLLLLQGLVAANSSHKEACVVNIRAWENIARFIVSQANTIDTLSPLTTWQQALSDSLWQQYLDNEREIQQHKQTLAANEMNPADYRLREPLLNQNREVTISQLSILLSATTDITRHTLHSFLANRELIIRHSLMIRVLRRPEHNDLTVGALRQLTSYLHTIHEEKARRAIAPIAAWPDDDSQEYVNVDMEIWEMLDELKKLVLPELCALFRNAVGQRIAPYTELFVHELAASYGMLAALLVNEGLMSAKDFLCRGGSHTVYHHSFDSDPITDTLWAIFLYTVVDWIDDLEVLETQEYDIGLDWLVLLCKPEIEAATPHVEALSTLLWNKSCNFIRVTTLREVEGTKVSRAVYVHDAIQHMGQTLRDMQQPGITMDQAVRRAKREQFSTILEAMMRSMQRAVLVLSPGTGPHLTYVRYVQRIIDDIRAYGSQIAPIPEFFRHRSVNYWPPDTDPALFTATLRSYLVQLSEKDNYNKISSQLFHFLLNGLRASLLHNQLPQHLAHLKESVRDWAFAEYLLKELLPAAIQIGFTTRFWILSSVYLQSIAERLCELLEEKGEHAEVAFKHLTTLLNMIRKCVWQSEQKLQDGIDPEIRGILTVTIEFWQTVAIAMRSYCQDTIGLDAMAEYDATFNTIVTKLTYELGDKGANPSPFENDLAEDPPTPHVYMTAMHDELKSWRMDPHDHWLEILTSGPKTAYQRVNIKHKDLATVLNIKLRSGVVSAKRVVGRFMHRVFC